MDFLEPVSGYPGCSAILRRTVYQPCIPEGFGDFRLTRTFRDAVYHIEVKNPDNVQKGVKKVVVDGKEYEGCLIPFEEGKKEYHVTVCMG